MTTTSFTICNYIVCLLFFFLTTMNIVFNLNFHFLLMFFASLNFFKCVFVKSHLYNTLFIRCQIHFDKFYLLTYTMLVVFMKKKFD